MSNEYEFSNIEAFRKLMITVQQTKDLIAWLDSFDIDWYIQKDITGRLLALFQVGKLSKCYILINIKEENPN